MKYQDLQLSEPPLKEVENKYVVSEYQDLHRVA